MARPRVLIRRAVPAKKPVRRPSKKKQQQQEDQTVEIRPASPTPHSGKDELVEEQTTEPSSSSSSVSSTQAVEVDKEKPTTTTKKPKKERKKASKPEWLDPAARHKHRVKRAIKMVRRAQNDTRAATKKAAMWRLVNAILPDIKGVGKSAVVLLIEAVESALICIMRDALAMRAAGMTSSYKNARPLVKVQHEFIQVATDIWIREHFHQ